MSLPKHMVNSRFSFATLWFKVCNELALACTGQFGQRALVWAACHWEYDLQKRKVERKVCLVFLLLFFDLLFYCFCWNGAWCMKQFYRCFHSDQDNKYAPQQGFVFSFLFSLSFFFSFLFFFFFFIKTK